jgi:hypothetical protein
MSGFVSFFFAVLAFGPRSSALLARHFTTWTPLALFALLIFKIGFHFLLRPVWTMILFYISHCHWKIGTFHHAQLFSIEMGSHELFFFFASLSWNYDPSNLSLQSSLGWKAWPTKLSYQLRWGLKNSLSKLALNYDPLSSDS